MIRIDRGIEPPELPAERTAQLATITATRPDRSDAHRQGYSRYKALLAKRQHMKCCYCERIQTASYNDVEHYRPFSRYWWLAWTWENLLFACPPCNRSGKHDAFPLVDASLALQFGESPPGREQPLLIDPSTDDPRDHIAFVQVNGKWKAVGRDRRGRETLRVLAFDDDYDDRVERHVRKVMEWIATAREAIGDVARLMAIWQRMSARLEPDQEFAALTEDVVRSAFPSFPDPPLVASSER